MIRRRIKDRIQQRSASKDGVNNNSDDWVMEDDVDIDDTCDREEQTTDEESSVKVWSQEDKVLYEQQMEHLHNQLTEALIENQELKVKLKESKTKESKMSSEPEKSKKASAAYGHYRGSNLTVSTTGDGFESVDIIPSVQRDPGKTKMIDKFKDWFFNTLYDFTEETYSEDTVQEAPPLQAKKLKENLQRLGKSSRPYKDYAEFLVGIIQWKSPSLSLVIFLAYMYCVWNGWLIQLVLVVVISALSVNYLHVIGIVEQFGFKSRKQDNTEVDEFGSLGLADKFQLVKEVGQMAQNTSELVADNLEKGQNLLLWYYPQATRMLYSRLCVAFVVLLVLPNSWALTIIGMAVGFKVFIIDNVYRKYPKVKEKYDSVSKLWRSLPTNSQLEQRQRMTEEDLCVSTITTRPADYDIVVLSTADTLFTERFRLPPTELPLEGWQAGKRCTLIDKERPLSNSKSGRLFLTHSYLCFERSPRPNDVGDRVAMPLKDIVSANKAKPFAVLPGSGMSLEITLKSNSKPIIFGAILHRDQAYISLCDQAMILGLDWGTDPDSQSTIYTSDPSLEPPAEGSGTDMDRLQQRRNRSQDTPQYHGSGHT